MVLFVLCRIRNNIREVLRLCLESFAYSYVVVRWPVNHVVIPIIPRTVRVPLVLADAFGLQVFLTKI